MCPYGLNVSNNCDIFLEVIYEQCSSVQNRSAAKKSADSEEIVSVTLIWYLSRYFAIVCRFSLFF